MVVIKNGSKRKFLLREKWKIISIIKVSLVIFKSVKLLKNQKYHWNVIIWNILFTFPSTKYFNLVYFWGLNFQLLWYIAPKWLFFFFGFWILPIIRVVGTYLVLILKMKNIEQLFSYYQNLLLRAWSFTLDLQ